MKIKLNFLLVAPLALGLSNQAIAQEALEGVEVNEITIDIADDARALRNNNRADQLSIVYDYMLERGDITQDEIDAIRAEKRSTRAELKALREAGNEEALAARVSELRERRAAAREELREYVENNEELSSAIEEQREQLQDRQRDRDGRGGGGNN